MMTAESSFECVLRDWCEREGIDWRHDIEASNHVFTRKPLDPIESALEECFGEFPKCFVSSYVIEAVKSLEDTTALTDMILRRLRRREERYG